jgi:hypothetical protein
MSAEADMVHGRMRTTELLCSKTPTAEQIQNAVQIPSDGILESHEALSPKITCLECKRVFQGLYDDHFGI